MSLPNDYRHRTHVWHSSASGDFHAVCNMCRWNTQGLNHESVEVSAADHDEVLTWVVTDANGGPLSTEFRALNEAQAWCDQLAPDFTTVSRIVLRGEWDS